MCPFQDDFQNQSFFTALASSQGDSRPAESGAAGSKDPVMPRLRAAASGCQFYPDINSISTVYDIPSSNLT